MLFNEIASACGKKIAVAKLNSEKSLNALSFDMVKLLMPQLQRWQSDPSIAMVMLEGAGDKAFCAGGDVVQLYNATLEAGKGNYSADVESFFTKEYQLDYLIHNYNKPILLWGHGIVMGGGLGLFAGASHRVVTERSRIAMPEITIGLYPDVGATYFLNKMPTGCGLFLGLTAASINATDAKFVDLADHFMSSEHKEPLFERLLATQWDDESNGNHQILTKVLSEFEQADLHLLPQGNLENHQTLLLAVEQATTLEDAVEQILNYPSEDKWIIKAQSALNHGSALTAHLIKRQLTLGKSLSLAECFRLELGLSVQCSAIGEFAEGVRALLIEKDNKPNWYFNSVTEVDTGFVDKMFESPWSQDAHPLADLGE